MRLTGCLYTCLLAFAATLAYIIGARLPDETRVIAAGVLTGVAASLPTSLLVSAAATRALLTRHAADQATAAAHRPPDPEPQIVVLPAQPAPPRPAPQPRPGRAVPNTPATHAYTTDVPGARRFTIIGGTGQDD